MDAAPMQGPLLDLLRAARGAGLRISPAESIEAARAVALVGYAERERLRDTLALVLAKTVDEKRLFSECFDLFFRRHELTPPPAAPDASPASAPVGEATPGEAEGGPLGAQLLAGDGAALSAALEAAAAAAGLSDIRMFTQVNLFARRILETMGIEAVERAIAAAGPAAGRLAQGRDWLRGEVRELVEQHLRLFAEGEMQALRERRLRQSRLAALDRRDRERMRQLVRAMARRLATRYGRPRKRDQRGLLDVRRTLRRNMAWGGTPFVTVWKQRRIEKPRLVVLCDVSGSVAALAEFLLLFLHELHDALAGLRAFAFSGTLVEVTGILRREPIERAIPAIMDLVGYGSSNYGAALAEFERGWMPILDPQTTVIILGDARGNYNDPRVDIVRAMAARTKGLVWLNPEGRTVWGSGDSDMPRYAPHCRVAAVCATLDQLERVVEEVLERGG